MAKLDREDRMTISNLAAKGCSNREIARLMGVSEGAVRYHRRREGVVDGRGNQCRMAAAFRPAIDAWLEARGLDSPDNITELHAWLVAEHDYPGGLRSVQRYVGGAFGPPPKRARRRVETPPGAQAQADWGVFPRVWLAGRRTTLLAFHLVLSHSRFEAVVWSRRKHLLSWLHVHNEALRRLGGVPATIRVDNEKTAVVHGAGAWGVLNPGYRRYAESMRFHIDPCDPREPQAKGKVERRIGDARNGAGPYACHWNTLEELQRHTDERVAERARRRSCPATGTSAHEAWRVERAALGPLPEPLPAPFDVVAERRVGRDCTIAFEGRTLSVPFALVGRSVEVRGCAEHVQVLHGAAVVAEHPRRGESRIVLDPAHFEGASTATVLAPQPLGRMGRRLADIAAMVPQRRPLDLYAALAEVAR